MLLDRSIFFEIIFQCYSLSNFIFVYFVMKRFNHTLTVISILFLVSCAPSPSEIDTLYQAGKFNETIKAINKRLFFHSGEIKMLHTRARSFEELGELDKARDDYNRILDNDPSNAQAYAGVGKILFEQGHYEIADLKILKAASLDPENFEIIYLAGRSQLMVKNWERAEIFLLKALEMKPDFAPIYYYTGMARASQGDLLGAASAFNMYLSKEPDNLAARYNRGFAMMKIGYLPWALEDFEFVLKNKPDHTEALARKGLCLVRMGNPEGCQLLQEAATKGSDFALSSLDEFCL